MSQYPKEQIWKIYEKLPDELKDAIFSHDTAENISNICEKNKITNSEKISQIARLTGDVLLGLLIPNELQESLEKELKLFLPVSLQNTVLRDFKERLEKEIEIHL